MAVVIGLTENNAPILQSVKGPVISSEERLKAIDLDNHIESSLKELEFELISAGLLDKKKGERVKPYWQLGRLTNSILDNANLLPAEVPLYFENLKLRLPVSLSAADRGPDRSHIRYCHRLGAYDESTAYTLKWSEWVTLFDSPSINKEKRFDKWFNGELTKDSTFFDRKRVRLIARILNNFFGKKMETCDLDDLEIERCYEQAKSLCMRLHVDLKETIDSKLSNLKRNRILISDVMDGNISGSELYDHI